MLREVEGLGMSSPTAPEQTSPSHGAEQNLSWQTLAAAVRRRARNEPYAQADLLQFAELLEAFAELEEMHSAKG